MTAPVPGGAATSVKSSASRGCSVAHARRRSAPTAGPSEECGRLGARASSSESAFKRIVRDKDSSGRPVLIDVHVSQAGDISSRLTLDPVGPNREKSLTST
jgi:hypothetical protein